MAKKNLVAFSPYLPSFPAFLNIFFENRKLWGQGVSTILKEMKAKIIMPDYIIFFSIVLFFSAHLSTTFIIQKRADIAKQLQVSEEAIKEIEINPLARNLMDIKGVNFIFSYLFAPAFLLALYFYIRLKFYKEQIFLTAYSMFFLIFSFINSLNNLAVLLAMD